MDFSNKQSSKNMKFLTLGITVVTTLITLYLTYIGKGILDDFVYVLAKDTSSEDFVYTNFSIWSGAFAGILLSTLCWIRGSAFYYNPITSLTQAETILYSISWTIKIVLSIFGASLLCFLGCVSRMPDAYWTENVGGSLGFAIFSPLMGEFLGGIISTCIILGIIATNKFWSLYKSFTIKDVTI